VGALLTQIHSHPLEPPQALLRRRVSRSEDLSLALTHTFGGIFNPRRLDAHVSDGDQAGVRSAVAALQGHVTEAQAHFARCLSHTHAAVAEAAKAVEAVGRCSMSWERMTYPVGVLPVAPTQVAAAERHRRDRAVRLVQVGC